MKLQGRNRAESESRICGLGTTLEGLRVGRPREKGQRDGSGMCHSLIPRYLPSPWCLGAGNNIKVNEITGPWPQEGYILPRGEQHTSIKEIKLNK